MQKVACNCEKKEIRQGSRGSHITVLLIFEDDHGPMMSMLMSDLVIGFLKTDGRAKIKKKKRRGF
jgi:hypothetical protein